jgi:hypothetical protein
MSYVKEKAMLSYKLENRNLNAVPNEALAKLPRVSRILWYYLLASVVLFAICLVGLVVDNRTITGQPAWLKPAKFVMSASIYAATFLWMLSFIKDKHPRFTAIAGGIVGLGFGYELLVIGLQAARGVTSHFNVSNELDLFLFSTMGTVITIVVLMALGLAIFLAISGTGNRTMTRAIQLGLIVAVYGAFLAFTMTPPKPDQLTTMQSGQAPTSIGGHSVGVAEDAPGLPVLGWKTEGGDLRVPHFFGLHALQLLPLLGFAISRLRFSERRKLALVWLSAASYTGFVTILLVQALRGQSVVAPDGLTLGLIGSLALVTAAVGWFITRVKAPQM